MHICKKRKKGTKNTTFFQTAASHASKEKHSVQLPTVLHTTPLHHSHRKGESLPGEKGSQQACEWKSEWEKEGEREREWAAKANCCLLFPYKTSSLVCSKRTLKKKKRTGLPQSEKPTHFTHDSKREYKASRYGNPQLACAFPTLTLLQTLWGQTRGNNIFPLSTHVYIHLESLYRCSVLWVTLNISALRFLYEGRG